MNAKIVIVKLLATILLASQSPAQIPVCILIYLVLARILDPYSCNFVIFLCILPLIFPGKSTWLDCCNSPLQLKIGENSTKSRIFEKVFVTIYKKTLNWLWCLWFAVLYDVEKKYFKTPFNKNYAETHLT